MPTKNKETRLDINKRYRAKIKAKKEEEKLKSDNKGVESFKKIVCNMSNLYNLHKSLLDSMKFTADQILTGEADLSEMAGDMVGDKDKAKILSSITAEDMEMFAKGLRGDNAVDIMAGKKLKSFKSTNQVLKAVEEEIETASKLREQLLLNKKAILGNLSNKALKVVEMAHARLGLQRATALVKMSSKNSTPSNSPPSSPSAPIVAEEGKNDPSTAGGGGVLASAFAYFGSSSSSEPASKRQRES